MSRREVRLFLVAVYLFAQAVRLPHVHADDGHEPHGPCAHFHFHMFCPHPHQAAEPHHAETDHEQDYPPAEHHDEDVIHLPDCLACALQNDCWKIALPLCGMVGPPTEAAPFAAASECRGHPPPERNASCPLYLELVTLLI